MPVILPDQDAEEAWLDHGTPSELLPELLVPLPDELTALRAVGPAVSDARHDESDCLDDAPPQDDERDGDGPGADSLSLF